MGRACWRQRCASVLRVATSPFHGTGLRFHGHEAIPFRNWRLPMICLFLEAGAEKAQPCTVQSEGMRAISPGCARNERHPGWRGRPSRPRRGRRSPLQDIHSGCLVKCRIVSHASIQMPCVPVIQAHHLRGSESSVEASPESIRRWHRWAKMGRCAGGTYPSGSR